MQVITSKDNEFVKHVKKLKDKKARDISGEFLVEGIKLVDEAIKENAKIKKIILCEETSTSTEMSKTLTYEIAKYDCIYVSKKVYESITDVINPQGIMAIIEKENNENLIRYDEDIIVMLDDIQDPGNLGTILRTVDSIGLKQIIVSSGTADVYNPKVVRSTMGAIFRVNVIMCDDLISCIKECKKHKFKLMTTSLSGSELIYDVDYNKKIIVIGNEANGVSEKIHEMSDERVKIPMLGNTESLNASVATGIVLYEYVRQKLFKK